jgi:phospholipase A-2-activating protein
MEEIKINENKNLFQLYQIIPHKEQINSISIFPNGNIISVSRDRSIQIYDSNFLLIQKISEAHKETIANLYIKNDNFFITCSKDRSLNFWKKQNINNLFDLNQTIKNAHLDTIFNIIILPNGNLISCSDDNTVKLWEEINNNKYQLMLTLNNYGFIRGILLIEEKNIFISSGDEGTKIYNYNNFNIINYFYAQCIGWNSLKKNK